MNPVSLIIVAGGSGTRMGADVPKQFLRIGDQPVLIHTLRVFKDALPGVIPILVLPEAHHDYWKKLYASSGENLPHELVAGGETRFHSVKNGLDKISSGLVMVHDGVRPLVSADTINNVLNKATETGAAIPCVAVNESLRIKQGNQSQVVDRSKFMVVQTPQCFSYDLMQVAFQQEYRIEFTDCASVIEAGGNLVSVVDGNQSNIKITHPADLIFAEAFMQANMQ